MPHFKRDNFNLFYREKGEGELLIILPGNTASSASYQNEIDHFSKKYRTIAVDFKGTGQSGRLPQWPINWFDENVNDVVCLIKYLGEKRTILVGSSGGAFTALLTAMRFPEKVKAVIADSFSENLDLRRIRQELSERKRNTPELIDFWKTAHGSDWREVVDRDGEFLVRLAENGGDIFKGGLKKIKCPVLLSGSTKDKTVGDIAEQLTNVTRQILHAQLFLVGEGGHPLMWTAPKTFSLRADLFLDSLN